ncbi:TPA: hypothetical protein HA251_03485 [Candidatus Woesearchaeota archaeon]|nr:hypothetical protein [Candidatus Woesearchaeota archaeon]
MALELSSVDVHYVVMDMQSLVGAKVEKAFQSDANKRDVLLQLYCADTKKRNLRILLPGILCTPLEKPDYPQLPPGFAMFLRKRLGGTRITSVEQAGFDRIIRIGFRAKRESEFSDMTLIIELIPPGNIILIDDKGSIINLLEQQQFKDRNLRSHQPYIAPPAAYDLRAESVEGIARHLFASTRSSIVTTLALHCGLGGAYAEEVCARAGIPKHRNDLTHDEVLHVAGVVKDILAQPLLAVTDTDGRQYPFPLVSRPTTPCETTTSFLDALCASVTDESTAAKATTAQVRQREKSTPQAKLKSMILAQQENVDRLTASATAEQRKAELLYNNYAEIQAMLALAHDARKDRRDIAQALAQSKGFVAYNDSTGELTVEFTDGTNDDGAVVARSADDATSEDS